MRLIGYVGGVEVSFDFTPPNTFKASVPKRQDGVYIVELHAVDNAGNITNYSGIFIKIDYKNLSIELLPGNYPFKVEEKSINLENVDSSFKVKETSTILYTQLISENYSYRGLIE